MKISHKSHKIDPSGLFCHFFPHLTSWSGLAGGPRGGGRRPPGVCNGADAGAAEPGLEGRGVGGTRGTLSEAATAQHVAA